MGLIYIITLSHLNATHLSSLELKFHKVCQKVNLMNNFVAFNSQHLLNWTRCPTPNWWFKYHNQTLTTGAK